MEYKRKTRQVSPETKQKISSSLTSYNATHPRSELHNQKISRRIKGLLEQDTEIIRFV